MKKEAIAAAYYFIQKAIYSCISDDQLKACAKMIYNHRAIPCICELTDDLLFQAGEIKRKADDELIERCWAIAEDSLISTQDCDWQ